MDGQTIQIIVQALFTLLVVGGIKWFNTIKSKAKEQRQSIREENREDLLKIIDMLQEQIKEKNEDIRVLQNQILDLISERRGD